YFCTFPHSNSQPVPQRSESELIEEESSNNQRAVALLQGFHKECLNYTLNWWTYSYCHGDKIYQNSNFPEKYKLPKLSYELGVYNMIPPDGAFYGDHAVAAAAGAQLVENDSEGTKYLRMWYGNGTLCQETGLKRVTEVQFSCCENDHIVSVKETTVCQYKSSKSITCFPILDEFQLATESFVSAPHEHTVRSLLSNNCTSPLDCSKPDQILQTSEKSEDDYETTQFKAETRSDLLKGAMGAGIHPTQTNIDEEAFDTLWLDIYDPIYVEGEEMDEVVAAANMVLNHHTDDDNLLLTEDGEDVMGETYGGAQILDDSAEHPEPVDFMAMMKDGLRQTRIDLWRKLVAKKKEQTISFLDDEDGMKLDESVQLNLDLWQAALEGIPDEAVAVLNELRGE
ncbi:Protein OS-9, partial [Rhizoclosmatium hyalinum]